MVSQENITPYYLSVSRKNEPIWNRQAYLNVFRLWLIRNLSYISRESYLTDQHDALSLKLFTKRSSHEVNTKKVLINDSLL